MYICFDTQGFFGKGALSRSKPDFNQRFRSAFVPNNDGETQNLRAISRRRYNTGKNISVSLHSNFWPDCKAIPAYYIFKL